jgi:hypothetical protein
MTVQITQVLARDSDVLEVQGYDDRDPNRAFAATGWQSAMVNYYPPDQYGSNGHLLPNAVSRPMTAQEQQVYWVSLLQPLVPVDATPPTVLYSNPQAINVVDGTIQLGEP